MRNFLKYIWHYTKKCGTFLGIQIIIVILGFVLLMIQNDVAHIVLGIVVVLLNGFLFYLIGKSSALKDFKFKRINLAKFGGNTPYYEKCKEMRLSNAITAIGAFFAINLILVVIGSLSTSTGMTVLRGIITFVFMGIMLIGSGTGFLTTVNGIAAVEAKTAVINETTGEIISEAVEAVEGVAGRPGLFPALFLPIIFAICACYVIGYYLAARKRNKQHVEIQEEIAMFDRMGKA